MSPNGSGDQAGWRLAVDQVRCISSGFCVGTAPNHFAMDVVSAPLADVVAPSDKVIEAAEFCPVEAISVFDVQTGTQLAPKR
ncbi:ferredoxin [Micromonospora peucetia]|uniref:ferredoxin n=1 Tax=Micromonospora peucetia TaxID=47871 RepID=UPI00224E127D|nr:ferredoxin [Micromonospora peucetia]MCX4386272.1 ferredoxin [Micromonospora peucetia]